MKRGDWSSREVGTRIASGSTGEEKIDGPYLESISVADVTYLDWSKLKVDSQHEGRVNRVAGLLPLTLILSIIIEEATTTNSTGGRRFCDQRRFNWD